MGNINYLNDSMKVLHLYRSVVSNLQTITHSQGKKPSKMDMDVDIHGTCSNVSIIDVLSTSFHSVFLQN